MNPNQKLHKELSAIRESQKEQALTLAENQRISTQLFVAVAGDDKTGTLGLKQQLEAHVASANIRLKALEKDNEGHKRHRWIMVGVWGAIVAVAKWGGKLIAILFG